jgi:aryl-alcohol dehydrogenase-like predicted oxidoreductase
MERRILGKTGVEVAVLGFGCGAVGGLMVRGTAADQERAVARALALGINYFDTAPLYGDGESEKNLGRILKTLRPNVVVGTKVRIPDDARGRAGQVVTASLEASLGRLGLERVDLLQLHNLISADGRAGTIGARARSASSASRRSATRPRSTA